MPEKKVERVFTEQKSLLQWMKDNPVVTVLTGTAVVRAVTDIAKLLIYLGRSTRPRTK